MAARPRIRGRAPKGPPVTWPTVRRLCAALPETEEYTCFGTPAFRVRRGKLLTRLREEGDVIVVKIGFDEREVLMQADPETFFLTDHYRDYPTLLVSLPRVRPAELRDLLERAWRLAAPARLVARRDAGAVPPARSPRKAPVRRSR
jgi:hypothetical protein